MFVVTDWTGGMAPAAAGPVLEPWLDTVGVRPNRADLSQG